MPPKVLLYGAEETHSAESQTASLVLYLVEIQDLVSRIRLFLQPLTFISNAIIFSVFSVDSDLRD